MGEVVNIVVLSFVLLLMIFRVNSATDDDDVVHRWCSMTDNNKLCVSVIDADSRSNLKNSLNGLCAIIRDRVVADATVTQNKIIPNLLKKTTNFYVNRCLKDCLENYDDGIYSLKSIDFSHIEGKTYYIDISAHIAAGLDEVTECESCFTEQPGTPSPLTSNNDKFVKIGILVAEILNLVNCNKTEAC
ncbi:hypothetical protein OROMI_022229 [Orobanche minor]